MIELKNIAKTYQMGKVQVKALQDVSLKIAPGEFVAVMGPSGSGKSTLMHIIGLLDRPDRGEYNLAAKAVQALDDSESALMRNRLVGFVFQQFHLLAHMNALENASLPLIYAGERYGIQKAADKIKQVGLADRAHHRPNELSGGQQQRVAIARALVNDPLIILADEPTGNLDSKSKDEIISILKELNRSGKTVVIVTHENEIAEQARRVISMRDGKIVSDSRNDAGHDEGAGRSGPAGKDEPLAAMRRVGRAEFGDFLRQAFFAMVTHKARSLLSILGILIGVAAVIAMLALGQGAKASIQSQLAALGSNLLMIRPGSSKVRGVALEAGSVTRFTLADAAAIARLGQIDKTSPAVTGKAQVVFGNKNWSTQIQGVDAEYEILRSLTPAVGRFFTQDEVKERQKVALLGPTVARELFGEENPVGQAIKINLINFNVIGVLPSKGASTFHDQDDLIVIPVTTAMYRLLGKEYVDSIFAQVKDSSLMQEAQDAITQLVVYRHRLKKGQDDTFQIRNMADIRATLEATTGTMSMLLGAIAAISLLVGGIGIMNIMLVSVSERTREIGLRKAIGATNKDIMLQFLVEAILMSVIGGVLGILLGSATAYLITVFAGWTVKISLFSIALATVFSVAVGIAFGLWPAQKASRLNPIEALRYE